MADDLFEYDDEEAAPKKRDNLFIWTVFILLLIGLAFACWLGSFYIFGHPEEARNYRILQKVKKIEPVKRFEITKAPPGDWMGPKALFEKYSKYSTLQIQAENAELLRTFVTNYRDTKKLEPYMRGNFTIADSAELTKKDFLTSGMVALGVSNDFPQVIVEHLYPMTEAEIAKARPLLITGNPIKLEKTFDLGAIIHIERVADGRMQFTVMPLLYGSYALSGGAGTFATEPPGDLHLESSLPVMKAERVDAAMKKYAAYRRSLPVTEPTAPGEMPKPQGPQIVRLDGPDGGKIPETGALPEVPVATPIPIAGRGNATPARKPPITVATLATPRPVAPVLPATPAPNVPGGVIKPFIASNPVPGLPSAQGNTWRTYKPGAIPPGRAVSPLEAASLEAGPPAERTYLRGNFVVTARGENRAVLRPRPGADGSGTAPVRVIVEYANGNVPPEEGANMDREVATGYEVRDVRKGATGELNIWVREIVQQP